MPDLEEAGLDVSVLTEVLECGDVEARLVLARQLAGLLADPETPEIERHQVVPVVLKLAVDEVADVRAVLAEELTTISELPTDVLFAVVADMEEISLPFIINTMAMRPNHMFAVLRVGDDPRQTAVARRPDLTPDVAAYIVAHGKLGACLALLDSQIIRLSDDDYRTMHERHRSAPEMAEKLLAVPTLPSDIRIAELRQTSSRMRQLMVETGWLPVNNALDIVTDAEDSTLLKIISETNENEIEATVAHIASGDLLTPSLVVRAASRGEMRVVAAILANLSGYSLARTRDMILGKKSSFAALFRKSGLPKGCYGILHAACDIHAELGEEGHKIDTESFGRRMLERLMTSYQSLSATEREKQIDYLGRFAEGKVKRIAQRLKVDFSRMAA